MSGIAYFRRVAEREDWDEADAQIAALDVVGEYAALERERDELRRELDLYKRAKAENDERFMRERDEARQELSELQEHCDVMDAGHEVHIARLDARVAGLKSALREALELARPHYVLAPVPTHAGGAIAPGAANPPAYHTISLGSSVLDPSYFYRKRERLDQLARLAEDP